MASPGAMWRWLAGVNGSGKSSLLHAIANQGMQ
jgi:ABC-type molybdenum transport system ATPase subunit/photorepair protein PhrA